MSTQRPLSISFPSLFLTPAWSSHPSCSIYSLSCEWMGPSVNGGCEVTPVGRGTQVGTWTEQLSRCMWLTDCSSGTRTSSHTAATWKQAIQLISTTISLTAILSQPVLRCRFTHLYSHSRPVEWSPVWQYPPFSILYNRGEAGTRIQMVWQFVWNAEIYTELQDSLI